MDGDISIIPLLVNFDNTLNSKVISLPPLNSHTLKAQLAVYTISHNMVIEKI